MNCPDCGGEARPVLDAKGRQVAIDPRGARAHGVKVPQWECIAEGTLFCFREHPPADEDRNEPRRAF